MKSETITSMTEEIAERTVLIDVHHDDDLQYPFLLKVRCIEEYLTIEDMRKLRHIVASALRKQAAVTK